jgi:hypothetical protein
MFIGNQRQLLKHKYFLGVASNQAHIIYPGKVLFIKKLKLMPSKNAPSKKKSLGYYNPIKDKKKEGAAAGGGMTKKGVAKYRKDNPGSKLKTAVTKCDVKVGTKAYKRQKAFCSRSKSWTGERGKAARRRWCCSRHR